MPVRNRWVQVLGLLLALLLVPAFAAAVECSRIEFRGKRASACFVDIRADRLRIFMNDANGAPLGSFAAVSRAAAAQGERLIFAMNAGIYAEDFSPVGLLVIGGQEVRPLNTAAGSGNFFLKPNGVFLLATSGVRILDTVQYAALNERVMLATQSGPLMLSGNRIHPAFDPYSKSRLIRNGVGVLGRDKAVFAISEEPVNFYEFTILFRDGLRCRDALYLDGTISSFFSSRMNRNEQRAPLGPIIAVTDPLDRCGEPARSLADPKCSRNEIIR